MHAVSTEIRFEPENLIFILCMYCIGRVMHYLSYTYAKVLRRSLIIILKGSIFLHRLMF